MKRQRASETAGRPLPLPEKPGPGWIQNMGERPKTKKRVRVFLYAGHEPAYADALNPMLPPGWGADTTRWSITGFEYDVAWWRPL